MAKKRRGKPNRHRLLVYYRLGQKLRTLPLLIAFLALVLIAVGWLYDNGILSGNEELLQQIWERRMFVWILIIVSFGLYVFSVFISRRSYVEVKGRALRVQAGLVRLDVSYKRIRQIRPVSIESQYPVKEMKSQDYALVEPFLQYTCTAVDLTSWPWPGKKALKSLWHKFLFTKSETGLLFIIENALVLNTQIDTARQRRSDVDKKQGYVDPIDRAFS